MIKLQKMATGSTDDTQLLKLLLLAQGEMKEGSQSNKPGTPTEHGDFRRV